MEVIDFRCISRIPIVRSRKYRGEQDIFAVIVSPYFGLLGFLGFVKRLGI